MSLLFNPSDTNHDYFLYSLNKTNNFYTNLLEPLDDDEIVLIIQDLLEGECVNMEPNIENITLKKATNLFGNEIYE